MGMKRKIDTEFDDAPTAKQMKLVPFPTYEADPDVAMSDGSSDSEPFLDRSRHNTASSTASSWFGGSSPVEYPTLSTHLFDNVSTSAPQQQQQQQQQQPVGILQPPCDGANLRHFGLNCTQIPKLRVACESGPGGRRTMWSHCEQCGAIAMVDSD